MQEMIQVERVIDDLSQTPAKLAEVRTTLRREYLRTHNYPWIVAYSGGKDSTLLLHLVFETLLKIKPSHRKREIHVVANDTLVESPLVINHLRKSMVAIHKAIQKAKLPMTTTITKPCIDQTFWVNVIGRGYIPPTRSFRWCTDRMKIAPTTTLIKKITASNSESILLIGTRKSESASRRRRMDDYGKDNLMNPHNQIDNCLIFSPIAEFTDNEVWATLLQNSKTPWGGNHRQLITLYRNAKGGDCPLVLSKEDAPSCGSSSPRFGCWTCTVVTKDRSLAGLIDSGFDELEPLLDFREWIVELREDEENRTPYRRNGEIKYREDGSLVRGPFTMRIRRLILEKLAELETEVDQVLISDSEKTVIAEIWKRDEIVYESVQNFVDSLKTANAETI